MSENDTAKIKTVKGPKAAIATFVRPRDGQRIYVFARKGESNEAAVERVMSRNGAAGKPYDRCQS